MWVLSLGGRRSLKKENVATQHSCLENPVHREGLPGYSPRGGKESDTAEQ